ncbi:hypothetical protein EAI_16774 [Harpegnathos saltator]|uniref:Uncharacterized protein n=1 Tax=Harpegnathos saltator TaxID=610380 RepID=E2C1T1_HARSA|nr:hypothetical protein EAI_16774 [Harpegnathos saltator]
MKTTGEVYPFLYIYQNFFKQQFCSNPHGSNVYGGEWWAGPDFSVSHASHVRADFTEVLPNSATHPIPVHIAMQRSLSSRVNDTTQGSDVIQAADWLRFRSTGRFPFVSISTVSVTPSICFAINLHSQSQLYYGSTTEMKITKATAFMSDDDSTSYYAATRQPNKAFPVFGVPGPCTTDSGGGGGGGIDPREAADVLGAHPTLNLYGTEYEDYRQFD